MEEINRFKEKERERATVEKPKEQQDKVLSNEERRFLETVMACATELMDTCSVTVEK
jgi:hypothetical protein